MTKIILLLICSSAFAQSVINRPAINNSYVPYTGAKQDVNLGTKKLTANSIAAAAKSSRILVTQGLVPTDTCDATGCWDAIITLDPTDKKVKVLQLDGSLSVVEFKPPTPTTTSSPSRYLITQGASPANTCDATGFCFDAIIYMDNADKKIKALKRDGSTSILGQ